MDVFIQAEIFKHEMFGITIDNAIWRIWFDSSKTPYLQLLIGDEAEYITVIRLLKAKRDLYK